MTFPQRITHSLGQSIGFRQRVSKWLHKKQKSNPTSLEESSKTLPKTPSQDSLCKGNCKCNCLKTEDVLESYREAAKADDFLFGDYDGYEAYREDS